MSQNIRRLTLRSLNLQTGQDFSPEEEAVGGERAGNEQELSGCSTGRTRTTVIRGSGQASGRILVVRRNFRPCLLQQRRRPSEEGIARKEAEWVMVGSKSRVGSKGQYEPSKRRDERNTSEQPLGSSKSPGDPNAAHNTPPRAQPKRRTPRTAAITITSKDPSFSYAATLRRAREEIPLEDIGIETSRIRKTANGGLLVEIPGMERATKAESLAGRLQ